MIVDLQFYFTQKMTLSLTSFGFDLMIRSSAPKRLILILANSLAMVERVGRDGA